MSPLIWEDDTSFICSPWIQVTSMVAWLILGAYLSNFLWSPLIYLGSCLWIYGYCTEPAHQDETDSPGSTTQDSRIKSAFLSFLGHLGFLGSDETDSPTKPGDNDDRRASDPAPVTSTPLVHDRIQSPIEECSELEPSRLTKALSLGKHYFIVKEMTN